MSTRLVGKGWRRDTPDHRDHIFAASAVLPQKMDLRPVQSPIRDQGQEGSCVGHGTSSGVDCIVRQTGGQTIFSPAWVYWQARNMEGTPGQDSGAEVRDGVKAVATLGCAPEAKMPYKAGGFKKKPTKAAAAAAKKNLLKEYARCTDLAAIRTALAASHPVVGGFTCYTNMWTAEVDRTGVLPLPGGKVDGGHCVLFVGYDDARNFLLFKNSWGPGWGEQGFGWLPYAFVDKGQADDFWCMVKEA